ncbi:MAG: sigma-70 family RNA polymerase sigma factor [Clostridia bacterium]|nr:sigma-70 family RNA polymerase sigma factor [Clostridia bacterium]
MSAQINELVTLAKNGDAEAFGELYEIYYKEMYYYACCVTGSNELAQDAVSEAVLAAFRQIGSLKKPEAFKGWLFKILCASCKRHYTENQHKKAFVYLDSEENSGEEPATDDDLDVSLDLKRALSELADDEREIVMLSTVSGYRSREIAEILGINAATVRSKLRRSLKKMKNMLEETTAKGG